MAKYNLSVHAIFNIFLERAFNLKLLRKIVNNLVIVHV